MALLADLDAVVPAPPKRPSELTIRPTQGEAPAADDLIGTLIERKALPNAITKGVHTPPKSALALTDGRKPSGAADAEALARATSMSLPPLPPPRPRPGGVTKAERVAPEPEKPAKPPRHSAAANPFGSLVVDAFNAEGAPRPVAPVTPELRGETP